MGNPCITFAIAQAGGHRQARIYLGITCFWLVRILHCLLLQVVDLLCKAKYFYYICRNNLQKWLSCLFVVSLLYQTTEVVNRILHPPQTPIILGLIQCHRNRFIESTSL